MDLCRSRDREDTEDEEDAYERKKMERKLREKEAAYQEVKHFCTVLLVCLFHLRGKFCASMITRYHIA